MGGTPRKCFGHSVFKQTYNEMLRNALLSKNKKTEGQEEAGGKRREEEEEEVVEEEEEG